MNHRLLLFLLPFSVSAQKDLPQKVLESKIENVTVYEKGAQITRTAKTPLAAGRTQLVWRGVSGQLDAQSIQVQGEGAFTILSVVQQTGFLNDKTKTDDRTRFETQKRELEEKILTEKALLIVYEQEQQMLAKNQEIGGRTTALKMLDLKEAVDFHRARLTEVSLKQLEINRNIKKLTDDVFRLNVRVNLLEPAQQISTSEIVVTVSAKEALPAAALSVSYFVLNAGWTPTYDLRVRDLSQLLELGYKAQVFQYSGEDWNNVKLSLSTANPRKSGRTPDLQTWYWGFPNNYNDYYNNVNVAASNTSEIVGTVRGGPDRTPLPGCSVVLKGTSLGTSTDENGNYKLAIPPDRLRGEKILVFSYIGMVSEERRVTGNTLNIDLQEDNRPMLEEVVVVGSAVRGRTITVGGAVAPKNKQLALDVEEKDSPTSQSFEIKVPYSVPSDGKIYAVEIKTEEIPVYYEYFCVPKIDREAFLNVKLPNWEKYSLLAGEANLFFEGVFVGKSALSLPNSDTLTVSMGRDKSVLVSRTKLQDFTKKQLLGGSKIENRRYEISVRNTKKQAINLVIEDQFPISNSKEITIENQSAPEAEINAETGKITWRVAVEAAREKKLGFGYSVKYPKSGVVSSE